MSGMLLIGKVKIVAFKDLKKGKIFSAREILYEL
jgi:hypothetical protein